MKYRVMVVEDETIEREANILTVSLARQDVEVVCSAANGAEALKQYRNFKPDIVLMDVDLPGTSGLEAIAEMQRVSPHSQYIILSAYNTFSYAQRALKMGVHEYLLKPCKTQELAGALTSAIEAIQAEQSSASSNHVFREKLDIIRPVLESECIFSIASMRESIPLRKMFDFMELKAQSGFVFVIRPENGQRRVISNVKADMETMGITCIGDILNGLCVFVALSERDFTMEQIEELMRFLSSLLRHSAVPCRTGAGQSSGFSDGLRQSYEQALKALTYADTQAKPFMLYREEIAQLKAPAFDVQMAVKRICAQMALRDIDGVNREVKDCFAQMMLLKQPRETLDFMIYRLYVQVLSAWSAEADEAAFDAFALGEIQACANLCVACDKMAAQLRLLLRQGRLNQSAQQLAGGTAAAAVNYLCQHYGEDINLNQIADYFGVTPFYLSKLIKKHTGKTFTDYLTLYRISKAKQLIAEGALSIKEITYAVGFNSQNYFAKIFKKHTGFTPSEFRASSIDTAGDEAPWRVPD